MTDDMDLEQQPSAVTPQELPAPALEHVAGGSPATEFGGRIAAFILQHMFM